MEIIMERGHMPWHKINKCFYKTKDLANYAGPLTSFPHSVLSSNPQLMTWIASFSREAGFVEGGIPP
jgi:hypothetical protein